MRKLFFLLVSTTLMMSCSSDDDNPNVIVDEEPQVENVYLKKLTNTSLVDSQGETETYVFEFEYNSDKKLSKLISGNGYTEFEYENGKLTAYTNYNGSNVTSSGVLVYNDDTFTHTIADDSGYIFRIDNSYSNDGKLIKTTKCPGTEPCVNSNVYTEYVYTGNNVTQIKNTMIIGGNPSTTTYNYSYDDKKSPFANYDLPTRIMMQEAFGGALSTNNYIQQTDYAGANVIYTNTYNSAGYVTIHSGSYESNGMLYMKNEYEYTEL